MKKSIALVALAFGVTNAFAQDLTSKKGEPILPEAGDWGISVDATPFLNYAGNMFGKTANNVAPTFNFLTNNQTITGKYFKDASMAYRGTLRIGFGSNTVREMEADRTTPSNTVVTYPSQTTMAENTWKHSQTTIGLAGGIEKRKGKTRLQGFYGGEVGVYFSTNKDKFTYGNALSAPAAGNLNPVTVDADDSFTGAGNVVTGAPVQGISGDARITERKNGSTIGFGVRGFIGAEYFILPKMSIGGEFGWGVGLAMQGKTKTTYESIGQSNSAGSTAVVGSTEVEGSKNGGFALDTDNKNSIWGPSATLRLAFHF